MTSLFSPESGHFRPTFTASQMEELHIQALIYKHMLMGVPVPHELLLAVRRSFDAMAAARLYHQQFLRMGYSSYLGKKLDPEPGRCRRTDGKKWRCAKEAYPDSKYCERHMRRGKNRSRKPVETQPHLQSQQSTAAAAEASLALSGGSDSLCMQNMNMQLKANGQLAVTNGICSSRLQLHAGACERNDKDFRYPYGTKAKVGENIPYPESPKSATGLGLCSTQNNPRGSAHSPMVSFSASGIPIGFAMDNQYQHSAINDLDRASINLVQKHAQPQTLFGHDFALMEPVKQSQSLRPFFDEWPNTRSSWSDQEESKSINASFSAT